MLSPSTAQGTAPPAANIAKMGADLIVMGGGRGRSRLAGIVLGSMADSVIHRASCPALVAQ
jgi:nucleotide-binding universal stress UspA family protein